MLALSLVLAVEATLPRLARRLRWRQRLGRRGLAFATVCHMLFLFALRHWVIPPLRRKAEEVERAKGELRARLGREPTYEELGERLGFARRP